MNLELETVKKCSAKLALALRGIDGGFVYFLNKRGVHLGRGPQQDPGASLRLDRGPESGGAGEADQGEGGVEPRPR